VSACEEVGWVERRGSDPTLSPSARTALADAWLRAARDEYASVAAFAKLSLSLVALGAPRELIEACHRAALVNLGHARWMFSLASTYAGKPFGPGALDALLRPERDYACDPDCLLRRVALEVLEDGCLGDGYAVEHACEALVHALDPEVRAVLGALARDAHHELAWRILYWCCSVGDTQLRAAVRGQIAALPRMILPPRLDGRIAADLHRHGQLDAELKRGIYVHVREELTARAILILDGLDARAIGFAPLGVVK
jgi:hypothetical protein